MSSTKLVMVEGIPGSGKTSTARFVQNLLVEQGKDVRLFLEGNLDHPADFESVACLLPEENTQFAADFPEQAELLAQWATVKDKYFFYPYRKMSQSGCPDGLCSALARYEIYENIPLERFYKVSLARWRDFAVVAEQEDSVWVFECCFIQNPITVLLAHHNRPEAEIHSHILAIARSVKALNPVLVYLDAGNVEATLEQAALERPKEWLDFVIQYVTGQGYIHEQGLTGFQGMVRFYEELRRISADIYHQLEWSTVKVDASPGVDQEVDWQKIHAQIRHFIEGICR